MFSLHILGTASQAPTRNRNHNGYFLRWQFREGKPEGFLFDCGENAQQRMIISGISLADTSLIALTHGHGDHTLGLPGVIQGISNATKDWDDKKYLPIYYPAAMQQFFDNLRNCCAYKLNQLVIEPRPIKTAGIIFEDSRMVITAQTLVHRMPTFGYRIEEKPVRHMLPDRLNAAGIFRQDIGKLCKTGHLTLNGKVFELDDFSTVQKGRSFAFVMDTVVCPGAYELAANADLLVCESTYLSDNEADAFKNGHLTARQAATIARDSGAKKLVLTHFSQRYPNASDFAREASEVFENVIAARDGDVIGLDSPAETLSLDQPAL